MAVSLAMPRDGPVTPDIPPRALVRTTWNRFVHLWKPMAGWTILVWAATTAVVSPLASAALGQLLVGPDRVIGNDALIAFALSPRGLTYLVLAGAIAVTIGVIRYAGLFVLTVDDMEGREPSVRATIQALGPLVPALFRLSAAAVVATLVAAIPLALGLGGIYLALLGEHDINYYLDAHPPEWRRALLLASLWAAACLAGVAYLLARTLATLPAYLDGYRPIRTAIRRAWAHTRGRASRILWAVPLVIGVWLAFRGALHGTYFLLGSSLIEAIADGTGSLMTVVAAVAVYAAGSAALDATLSFFGFSFVSMLMTRVYYTVSRARAEQAADAAHAVPAHAVGPTFRLRPEDYGGLAEASAEAVRSGDQRIRPGAQPAPRRAPRPVRIIAATLVLFAVGASLSSAVLTFLPDARDIIITAHRAGATAAPENTLLALDRAIAAGADVAEIDVQRTRDGVIVVAHDADLMRTARDARRIAESAYADLREVVLGPDGGPDPDLRRVATLDQFLDRSRGRITLLIELKYYGWDPELAPQTIAHVRARGMEDDVWMMSLNQDAVHQVRQLAPAIVTGYLATAAVGSPARLPITFLGVPPRIATPAFVRDAHGRRVQVHVWTLNRADAMMEAAGRGADGIITDDVALGARFRDELSSLPAVAHVLLRFHSLFLDEEEALGVEEQ